MLCFYKVRGKACNFSGYSYLIVLISVTKMIILKWVFVKVIRRQMIYCIEQREKYNQYLVT